MKKKESNNTDSLLSEVQELSAKELTTVNGGSEFSESIFWLAGAVVGAYRAGIREMSRADANMWL